MHQLGGGLTCHQRDLSVPALDRQRRPVRQLVAVRPLAGLLLGEGQRNPAAARLALLAEAADLAQQLQRLGRGAVVERTLDARIVELLAAADEGSAHLDLHAFTARVDLHRPEERRACLAGEKAACALGELRRIQARVRVGRVQGLATGVRLDVHRPARGHKGSHVGDRVTDAVAPAVPLEVKRLVEVT